MCNFVCYEPTNSEGECEAIYVINVREIWEKYETNSWRKQFSYVFWYYVIWF